MRNIFPMAGSVTGRPLDTEVYLSYGQRAARRNSHLVEQERQTISCFDRLCQIMGGYIVALIFLIGTLTYQRYEIISNGATISSLTGQASSLLNMLQNAFQDVIQDRVLPVSIGSPIGIHTLLLFSVVVFICGLVASPFTVLYDVRRKRRPLTRRI